jgi:hypothetical protein
MGRSILYFYDSGQRPIRKVMMSKEHGANRASEEFADVNLGDKRLNTRWVTLCDRFSDSPESPINQACEDWAETKAAHRFFRNDQIRTDAILAAHRRKTARRARAHKTVLAIQDTSHFVYASHLTLETLGPYTSRRPSLSHGLRGRLRKSLEQEAGGAQRHGSGPNKQIERDSGLARAASLCDQPEAVHSQRSPKQRCLAKRISK